MTNQKFKSIEQMIKAKSWTRPDNYMGPDHDDTISIGIGQSRDSERLEQSNFDVALHMLGGESKHVEVIRDSHWAVGWVEHIRVSKKSKKHLKIALDIINSLEHYPVLDDSDYYERECEECRDTAKESTTNAVAALQLLTDIPFELAEELAEDFAYEVVYESSSYYGEIYFDFNHVKKIASGIGHPCASDAINHLRTLNGF